MPRRADRHDHHSHRNRLLAPGQPRPGRRPRFRIAARPGVTRRPHRAPDHPRDQRNHRRRDRRHSGRYRHQLGTVPVRLVRAWPGHGDSYRLRRLRPSRQQLASDRHAVQPRQPGRDGVAAHEPCYRRPALASALRVAIQAAVPPLRSTRSGVTVRCQNCQARRMCPSSRARAGGGIASTGHSAWARHGSPCRRASWPALHDGRLLAASSE